MINKTKADSEELQTQDNIVKNKAIMTGACIRSDEAALHVVEFFPVGPIW